MLICLKNIKYLVLHYQGRFTITINISRIFTWFLIYINYMIFRLAVNNMHYVSNILGIKDPIHKQKIALKAMDVVLFGPPRGNKNYLVFIKYCNILIN